MSINIFRNSHNYLHLLLQCQKKCGYNWGNTTLSTNPFFTIANEHKLRVIPYESLDVEYAACLADKNFESLYAPYYCHWLETSLTRGHSDFCQTYVNYLRNHWVTLFICIISGGVFVNRGCQDCSSCDDVQLSSASALVTDGILDIFRQFWTDEQHK